MMRKFYSRLIVVFALMLIGITGAWAQTQSKRTSEFLPRVVDFELQPGKMYIVQPAADAVVEDGKKVVTLDASVTAGKLNGLRVAKATYTTEKQAPILFIPADVKLVVKGANANGMNGAGAGIYVPTGAELIITGAGQLVATGGNAANGSNGEDGHNPKDVPFTAPGIKDFAYWVDVLEKSGNMEYSGRGGNGGNGGGGAGAGIGGIGGAGGVGGAGGAAVHFQDAGESSSSRKDGKPGAKGGNGSNGAAMGKVSIMGTVTVTATAGAAADQGGTGGQQGYSFWHRTTGTIITTAHNIAGGGGAGAGGGAGYGATYGIGGGGAGAGAGGGGGSGAVDWREILGNTIAGTDNNSCRAASGAPGTGNVSGGTATTSRNRDSGAVGNNFTMVGGTGGAAGAKGNNGGNGTLYIASGAHVNNSHETPGGTQPNDMNITLTFKNNEFAAKKNDNTDVAVGATVGTKNDVIIGDPLPNAEIATYQLHADSKYFAGYYTNDQGLGNRMYKGDLTKVANAVAFSKDQTFYAHFSHNQHRVNWDYSYDNNGSITAINDADRIKYGKLVFYFRDGTSTERILDVSSAETFVVPNEQQYPLRNHTIASGEITLYGDGDGTETEAVWTKVGTGNEATFSIHLTDAQLAQFISYEFVPMTSTSAQAPATWIKTTNADGHVTTFSFIGNTPENCFQLKWTVTLQNLAMYPDVIYAQPLYKSGEIWPVISQTAHTLGVECVKTTDSGTTGDDSWATYTFSYPVWQKDDQSADYQYRLGLTGFRLNGQTYFLNTDPAHPEIPTEHYISDVDKVKDSRQNDNVVTYTKYLSDTNIEITMTLGRNDIPVLRLDANGGTLDNGQPELVVTTYGGTIAAPKTAYPASRAGYTFLGWADSNTATEASETYNSQLNDYKVTKTIYAVWKENVAPVITTDYITYTTGGASVFVSVTDNVGLAAEHPVKYIINTTGTEPTESDWNSANDATKVDGQNNQYRVDINIMPFAYVYILATDAAGNTTIESSGKIQTDVIEPDFKVYPTGNVCNFPVEITATDNHKLAKVEISKDGGSNWTVVTPQTKESGDQKWIYTEPKLGVEYTGDTKTPVKLSLKITDEAGNIATYFNFTNMYYDHAWDTSTPHKVEIKTGTDTYQVKKYYNCKHNCGHIWVVDYTYDGTTFGEPGDGTSETGYKHTSNIEDHEGARQYQEQGLMRDATDEFVKSFGSVVVKNGTTTIAVEMTINEGLQVENATNIELIDDVNVGNLNETIKNKFKTPSSNITVDLNGYGLLVDGSAGAITGNEHVTILLNDNGNLDYANQSTVTGSPIKYVRNFATTARQGKWQALYLPFDAAISDFSGYTVGKPKEVEITETTASLSINKTVSEDDLVAFKHLFIKSSDGKIEITKTTELKPYDHADSHKQTVSKHYTFDGSLKASDNVAGQETKSYWVLTNGGAFSWAKKDSHQRPYHWVIYYTPAAGGEEARPTTLSIVETEDDPTAIRDITVDEAEQAEAAIYSLSGQRMPAGATLPSGIYVRNGKKIYVK